MNKVKQMERYYITESSDFYGVTYHIGKYDPEARTEIGFLADVITIETGKGQLLRVEQEKNVLSPEETKELREVEAEAYRKAEALLEQTIELAEELLSSIKNEQSSKDHE